MNKAQEKELASAVDTIKTLLEQGVTLRIINNRLSKYLGMGLTKPIILHSTSELMKLLASEADCRDSSNVPQTRWSERSW